MGCLFPSSVLETNSSDCSAVVLPETSLDREIYQHCLTLEEVYQQWNEDTRAINVQKERIEKLMKDNHCLLSTISKLKKELRIIKAELESMTKFVRMIDSSTDDLNKILSFRKQAFNKGGVGFSQSTANEFREESSLSKVFVPA